jgi:hypothetical protein
MIFQTNFQFVVGSARRADRTPQRGVPTFLSTLNPSASAESSDATTPKRSEGGQLSTN